MRLLVLGGEDVLGYHVMTTALGHGHEVFVLEPSGESVVEGAVVLSGDREGDLSALETGGWDAVLDTHTDADLGAPTIRRTAELLSGRVGVYGWVSGTAPHATARPGTPTEEGRVPGPDLVLGTEQVLADAFDGPLLLPRVGALIGPQDPDDRFSWWPVRLARARAGTQEGPVLAPGDPGRPVQYSDVRDVAEWVVRCLAEGRSGTFHAVGPGRRETLGDVLDACQVAAGAAPGDVELVWADEQWLRAQLTGDPEDRRPMWYPEDRPPPDAVDGWPAPAAGLTFRPLVETARDTLAWAWDHALADGLRAGMTTARERELIAGWRAHAGRRPRR